MGLEERLAFVASDKKRVAFLTVKQSLTTFSAFLVTLLGQLDSSISSRARCTHGLLPSCQKKARKVLARGGSVRKLRSLLTTPVVETTSGGRGEPVAGGRRGRDKDEDSPPFAQKVC